MDSLLIEILFGSFFGLLILGAPITVALGVASLIAMLYLGDNPIKMVQMAWSSVGSFPLMALPAFILAGALMEAAGLSRRLIAFAESLAGPFTGGLGAATVMACLFFGAIYVVTGIAVGYALFWRGEAGWLVPVMAGFPLIAPFAAVGLYEVSRRREQEIEVTWGAVLGALRGRGDEQLLLMGGFVFVAFTFFVFVLHATAR